MAAMKCHMIEMIIEIENIEEAIHEKTQNAID